ncbi:uncharacterized protein BX664DRAFT_318192 [Halteromyces radiatus]|uniref:uncharacterized protein n=1 Tax=Halteromyces radiatus TaxID=101107 RepID=UPI0022210232|nr:uncharacterized protein BX664DRAFT_318192 [Halteromyces radiatus]KAI8078853.1 hypothetical protein BX664DRAFT_318192 [Halteromyces radiatus]
MPSEKFKISKASRSIRHAAQNFFGTFSASPNGNQSTYVSYPIEKTHRIFLVGGNIPASLQEDPETHLDRRSAHNALERQRRETLNSKFQELAHALPALQTVRRPSKTMIVAKSLDYVTKSIQRETNYVNQIKDLRKQNERLRKQAKAAKLAMTKQQNILDKKKTSSSTASSQPMTPPLSTSSSCGMQRTATVSTTKSSSSQQQQQQQMSPPLTPETPRKQPLDLIKETSPLIDTNTFDQIMISPQQQMNQSIAAPLDSIMMPQWSTQSADPNMTLQQQQQQAGFFLDSPAYQQPMLYQSDHLSINGSHFMPYQDTVNPMLFSHYQWQDNTPSVYHQGKPADPLYHLV